MSTIRVKRTDPRSSETFRREAAYRTLEDFALDGMVELPFPRPTDDELLDACWQLEMVETMKHLPDPD